MFSYVEFATAPHHKQASAHALRELLDEVRRVDEGVVEEEERLAEDEELLLREHLDELSARVHAYLLLGVEATKGVGRVEKREGSEHTM